MLYTLKRWWATVAVVTTILVFQQYHLFVFDRLSYDPAFIRSGEVWRLISCHFLHLNWNHVWLNLAGYAIITYSFRDELPASMELWTLFVCGLGTSIGLYFFDPAMYSYVGLSGALHGFLLAHLIRTLRNSPIFSSLFIIGIVAKLAWEHSPYADTSATAKMIGGFVAVNAHLSGGVTGVALGIILFVLEKDKVYDRSWMQKSGTIIALKNKSLNAKR